MMLTTGGATLLKSRRLHRLGKVFRLLRMVKMTSLSKLLERTIDSDTLMYLLSILKMGLGLAIAVHFISCMWYQVGLWPAQGWANSDDIVSKSLLHKYFAAARWTIAQISLRTDNASRTGEEYMFTCFVAMFGLICVSACISQITAMAIEFGNVHQASRMRTSLLQDLVDQHQLSPDLVLAVRWYFKHRSRTNHKGGTLDTILGDLPPHLQMDVMHEVHLPVLTVHVFFSDLSVECPRLLSQLACKSTVSVGGSQGEVIYRNGEPCSRMFFVVRGKFRYFPVGDGDVASKRLISHGMFVASEDAKVHSSLEQCLTLRRGGFICEPCLWTEWETQGIFFAASDSTLLTLEASEFALIVHKFSDVLDRACLYAKAFLQELAAMNFLSDIIEPPADYAVQAAYPARVGVEQ